MNLDTLPLLSVDLVEALDKHYPPIRPADCLSLPEKQMIAKASKRELVDFLLMVAERTKDEAINNV